MLRRLGSGGSSSLEQRYYHFTFGHAAPRTAGCLGVTERPAERAWGWAPAAAGGDGFLNGLEEGGNAIQLSAGFCSRWR